MSYLRVHPNNPTNVSDTKKILKSTSVSRPTRRKSEPSWMTHKPVEQKFTARSSAHVKHNAGLNYRPPRHVGGLEPAGNQFELFEDSNDLEEFEPSGASKAQQGLVKHFLDNLQTNMIGPKKDEEDVDKATIREDLKELRNKLTAIKAANNPTSLIKALEEKAEEVEEKLDKIGFKNKELKFEKYKSKAGHKLLFQDLKNFEKLSKHWEDNDTVIKGAGNNGKDYKGKGIEYARKHIEWKEKAGERAEKIKGESKGDREARREKRESKLSKVQQKKVNDAFGARREANKKRRDNHDNLMNKGKEHHEK